MLTDTRNEVPASVGRTAIVALGLAVLMCWPLWVTGQAFVFFDTEGYLENGDKIFALLQSAIAQAVGSSDAAGGAEDFDPREGQFLRSFGYAAFASGAATLGGALLWRWFDQLTQVHRAVLVALACLTHYGNPPVAFYGAVS